MPGRAVILWATHHREPQSTGYIGPICRRNPNQVVRERPGRGHLSRGVDEVGELPAVVGDVRPGDATESFLCNSLDTAGFKPAG